MKMDTGVSFAACCVLYAHCMKPENERRSLENLGHAGAFVPSLGISKRKKKEAHKSTVGEAELIG